MAELSEAEREMFAYQRFAHIKESLQEEAYGESRIKKYNLRKTMSELHEDDMDFLLDENNKKYLMTLPSNVALSMLEKMQEKGYELLYEDNGETVTFTGRESKDEIKKRVEEIAQSLKRGGLYGKDRIEKYGLNVTPLQLMREDRKFLMTYQKEIGLCLALEYYARIEFRSIWLFGCSEDIPVTYTGEESDKEVKIRLSEIAISLDTKGEYGKDRIAKNGWDITPQELLEEEILFVQCNATKLNEGMLKFFDKKFKGQLLDCDVSGELFYDDEEDDDEEELEY